MELNLKEVLDDLIAFVVSLPDYTGIARNVKEYEGEYDDDDWTEKHPSCLVEITGSSPAVNDASGDVATRKIEFLMLVGNRLSAQKHPLELVSEIAEAVEQQEFTYSGITYLCNLVSMNFFARNKSVKIYALKFVMMT